jgi:hypothetical protein
MRKRKSQEGRNISWIGLSFVIGLFIIVSNPSEAVSQQRADQLLGQIATVEQDWNTSIKTADSVNLQITLREYYTQHFRAIASYILQYFDSLRTLNIQPDGVEPRAKLDTGLYLWQKAEALFNKVQILDKKAKATPELTNYTSAIQLLSDRRLLTEHYEFLNYVEDHYNQLQFIKQIPFKELIFQHVGMLEEEMKKRELYPSKINSTTFELLQQRYLLIKQFEAIAIEEAYSIGDASPEIVYQRQRLIDILQKISSIHDRLGIKSVLPAELLREKVIRKRIEILNHAYHEVLKKHHLQRHLNPENKQHLSIIEESLAIELQELFKLQNADLLNNIPPEPPLDPLDVFSPPKNPLLPGNGKLGLSLRELFSETDMKTADIKGAEDAQKFVQRSIEKLQALVPSKIPGTVEIRRTSAYRRKLGIPSIRDELESLTNRVYDAAISGNIQKAEFYDKMFVIYQEEALGRGTLSTADFIATNDKNQLRADLEAIKQNLEKQKASGSALYIRPSIDHELQFVEQLIIRLNNSNETPRSVEALSGLVTRPPPNTESFAQKMLSHELRIGELIHATYGQNTNPSISHQYKTNVETKAIQESTGLITAVNEYLMGDNPTFARLVQSLPPELIEQLKLQKDVIQLNDQEQLLSDKVNRTLAKANTLAANIELPSSIITELKKAQKALPPPKYSLDIQDIHWRPNKPLSRIRSMVKSKDPGGIWLTPAKQQIIQHDNSSKELWLLVSLEETCPDDSEYGQWVLDDKKKVCFTDAYPIQEKKHWLYQVKRWK